MNDGTILKRLELKWRTLIVIKAMAWVILIGIGVHFFTGLVGGFPLVAMLSGILGIALVVRELRSLPNLRMTIELTNSQFPDIQFSSALFMESSAGGLAAIQKQRLAAILLQAEKVISFPIRWKELGFGSLLIVLVNLVAFAWSVNEPESPRPDRKQGALVAPELAGDSLYLEKFDIHIDPPAYTGLPKSQLESWNISAIEGSVITWSTVFSGNPDSVWLDMKTDGVQYFRFTDNRWVLEMPIANSLYTLHYSENGEESESDYHNMSVLEDQAPKLTIEGIPQFQRLDFRSDIQVPVVVNMSDDFGLTDAYLIATISKGSGESIKFREQKISFNSKVEGEAFTGNITLSPSDYDMEPGNELYFYAYAEDNHQPIPQSNRTETYFFVLKDTSQVEFSLQGALGVDLMPDYFRSQLQIILDTEKLVAERGKKSNEDFNAVSNELGFDQKSLRIKYGQFIGEEEDSGLEVNQEVPEGAEGHDHSHEEEEEDVVVRFGHDTDKENEEGEWMDRGTEQGHDHDHEESLDPGEEEDPLEGFLHNHEDEETATFYTQTLKSKLRAALSEMWDAELYLRLYQPKKSLPYQYRAHELLKEIRNHARVYVQRIGFDPPPVNESESRLTGDLDELNSEIFLSPVTEERKFEAITRGIEAIGTLLKGEPFDEQLRADLEQAGTQVARMAIEEPGRLLHVLNGLKNLLELEEIGNHDYSDLKELGSALTSLLPQNSDGPSVNQVPQDEYSELFLDLLSASPDL